jgi:hypothetical protein
MRKIIAVAGILFSSTLARAASPSAQLTVALALEPGVSLPGIPVSFRMTFTNTGGAAIAIPPRAALLVRDDQGQSFLAYCDAGRRVLTVEEWAGQRISPHQSSVYTLNTRGLMNHPAWFIAPALARPGRFELQVLVGDDLPAQADIEEMRQHAAVSNTVTLTLQEPTGVDAEVWRLMKASGGATWNPGLLYIRSGQDLAKRIVAEYPGSSYTPWFAAMGAAPTLEGREAILRDWLSRAPEDSNTNWRRFRLAEWQIALGGEYGHQHPELSHSSETNARAILNAILKQSDDDELKKHAKDRLDYLDDPPIDWEKE